MSLDYESAYHCHSSITLDCGPAIVLKSINQYMTYRGLLEGMPDSDFNQRRMESAREEGRRLSVNRTAPYLIFPHRRDYFRSPGDMDSIGPEAGEQGFMLSASLGFKPEWLPLITCIADFQSVSSKNPRMDGSSLAMVWFQDEYALPIAESVLMAIKRMDWHAHAADYEY